MRWPSISRRWLIAGGIGIGTLLALVVTLKVIYPRVGASMIKKKISAKIAGR